jgi:hypothetical protein
MEDMIVIPSRLKRLHSQFKVLSFALFYETEARKPFPVKIIKYPASTPTIDPFLYRAEG